MVRRSCYALLRWNMNSFSPKFGAVFIAMVASTIPVSILGLKFSMRVFPFWTPEQFSQ